MFQDKMSVPTSKDQARLFDPQVSNQLPTYTMQYPTTTKASSSDTVSQQHDT
jgi:hypothetical protein